VETKDGWRCGQKKAGLFAQVVANMILRNMRNVRGAKTSELWIHAHRMANPFAYAAGKKIRPYIEYVLSVKRKNLLYV
jgi:hypothetical protein